MTTQKIYLGQLEETVLLATYRLGGDGYGASIQEFIHERTGRDISLGALYATLDRLERKGLISSRQGGPTPERGGRAKRHFKIEAAGIRALADAHRARAKLIDGLKVRWA